MNTDNKKMTKDELYIADRKEKMINGFLGDAYIHPSQLSESEATFGVKVTKLIDSDEKDVKVFVDAKLFSEHFLDGLNSSILVLMTALVSHVGKDGFAFPSVEVLHHETGLSESTIKRLLDGYANVEIKGRTLFYKETQPKGAKRQQNLYYIPNCTVSFPDERDEMTEQDIIDSLDKFITNRHNKPEPVEDTVEDIVEDNTDVEDVKPEAVPVEVETQEESLFIMPELVVNDVPPTEELIEATTEDIKATEELTGIDKLRAFSEQSMPTYKAPTTIPATDVKKDTKDVDMSIFKEVHDATSTYEKPKFKRGSKTSVGSVKKSTNQVETELDTAEDVLNKLLG